MPSNGNYDESVTYQELKQGSVVSFDDITLDNEWWVYFKPTNNEEAKF